jgi:serine/threonine-protein kinase
MATTDELPDADVVDLEPTLHTSQDEFSAASAPEPYHAARPITMALDEGSLGVPSRETQVLRRARLAGTSLLLAVVYVLLLAWELYCWQSSAREIWLPMVLPVLLSGGIAAVLMSGVALSDRQVRALEFALFGGLTLLLVIFQYVIGLELIRRGDVPGMVGFMKNGVMQVIMLMLLFGTFIPNNPKTVAWVVLLMALAPLFGIAILTEHPEAAGALAQSPAVERAMGSNALFLLLGAVSATFGAFRLNGLQSELHAARRYGNYRLVRKLGEGGMGEVYLAEHLLLKRPCAIKLIRAGAGADPTALARFEREVQSAARLAHPNTIEIFDYGRTGNGTFYYVMEYLNGLSLADLVQRAGPLSPGRVIYLFRQICAGLAEAHALGLVHRDLKPGNIFVAVRGGESDVAKVLDFGLVKLTRDPGALALSGVMTASGTPMFMAPEQATANSALDARADIYALGAAMYHALTKRPPFMGDTASAILKAHVCDPVLSPSQVNPRIPADLEQVVLRCLAKKPEDRYPSVKALSQALAACESAADWGPNRADAWWVAAGFVEQEASPPLLTEMAPSNAAI